MNEEEKRRYKERYKEKKADGEMFFPDAIAKDAVVSLGIFVLLILLATFVGIDAQPKADPSDTSYLPRPEWYFLFLFKFFAIYGQIPVLGKIEWIATVAIPGIAIRRLRSSRSWSATLRVTTGSAFCRSRSWPSWS